MPPIWGMGCDMMREVGFGDIPKDKTLFFDFDSTIADTEPCHIRARDRVLEKYGIRIDDWGPYIGKSDSVIFSSLKEEFGLDMDVLRTVDAKMEISEAEALGTDIRPYPKVARLLSLPNMKFVITYQRYGFVRALLERWGLLSRFGCIIALQDHTVTKAGEIVALGFDPKGCMLFDDIPRYLDEAVEAGMGAVLVKDGTPAWYDGMCSGQKYREQSYCPLKKKGNP